MENIIEIRKTVQIDDFDAISRIYVLSWKTAYAGIMPQRFFDGLAENCRSDNLKRNAGDSLVLCIDGAYAGISAVCGARDVNMQGWGEVVSIYLLPEYFGKGYGKLLLSVAVEELVNIGYQKLYLWVLEENLRARVFYEKHGFICTSDKKTLNIGGKDLIEVRYIYNM